jgi:uncharacterized protein with FMN-binding domain
MSELMRRAAPGLALAGVALATVGVLDPALHTEATDTAASPTADAGTSDDTGAADTGDATDPGNTPTTDGQASTEAAPAPGDCSTTTEVTGDAAMTRWGPVQVRMEFAADGTVCGVQAVTYPEGDHRSAQINGMAIPYLDAQATDVGVEFDAVSGATYTSEAYRESMQSILDQR